MTDSQATVSSICAPSDQRLYVLAEDLGLRSRDAQLDRALYVYCGVQTAPKMTLTQGMQPSADGLDYDGKGHIFVGERSNQPLQLRWLTYDSSGQLNSIGAPLQHVSAWAYDRQSGAMYTITDASCKPLGHDQCELTSSLNRLDASVSKVVLSLPISVQIASNGGVQILGDLTFNGAGRFYLTYGRFLLVFDKRTGRCIHRFYGGGSGPWKIGEDGLLYVHDGENGGIAVYNPIGFKRIRHYNIMPFSGRTIYNEIAVTRDGTMYLRAGDTLEMYLAGHAQPTVQVLGYNGEGSKLALDADDNLYIFCRYNSAFSGGVVASLPGVYVYKSHTTNLVRRYDFPPLALTWQANDMLLVPGIR